MKTSSDLYRVLDKCEVGQTVKMEVVRGDAKMKIDVTLEDIQTMATKMQAFQLIVPGESGGAIPLPPGQNGPEMPNTPGEAPEIPPQLP